MSRNHNLRTWFSFGVLITAAVGFMLLWTWLDRQPDVDGTPRPFRQMLELNGKLWKAMFNSAQVNTCRPPPKGKRPRVNGDIGIQEKLDINKWSLQVVADDQDPHSQVLTLTMQDIKALPRTEMNSQFRCIEGWSEDMSFAGVKFSDFVQAYHLNAKQYVGLATPNGEYYVSIDIESMLHQQTLLAYEMNGEPLREENGAPLRLVIPVKYGIKNIKRIGKIVFSSTRPPDYWAEQGYDWYAGL